MTNEEIIEKIRTTLAEEFEVDIDVIQPDAPLMETLELDSQSGSYFLDDFFVCHISVFFSKLWIDFTYD